jgi:hypothetical protein
VPGQWTEEHVAQIGQTANNTASVIEDDPGEISESESHQIIAEADGEMYQTFAQGEKQGIAHTFRDPWHFRHPETGEDLIVFEGNTPTGTEIPEPESCTDASLTDGTTPTCNRSTGAAWSSGTPGPNRSRRTR